MRIAEAAALTVAAYLAGSIPSGLIFGKVFTGEDIRNVGSGNIGAANVSRLAGYRIATLVLVFDMAKGLIPVLLGRAAGLDSIELAIIGGFAVLGHDFSVFLRFTGGKGVATTLGVALGLAPLPTVAAAVVWLVAVGLWKYSSVGSLVALWTLPVFMAAFDEPAAYIPLTAGLALLGLYTHRDNVIRLGRGEEARVGQRAVG